jgi:hypothetical protein
VRGEPRTQDARACSAVLKVRSVAHPAGAPSTGLELDDGAAPAGSRAGTGCAEGGRFRLLQNGREDKCVAVTRAGEAETYEPARAGRRTHQCTNWVSRHRVIIRSPTMWNGLLRKEVIQPHLPVRLPCYDFTPITDPTFDGSLSCELGHRLRVLPTFVV